MNIELEKNIFERIELLNNINNALDSQTRQQVAGSLRISHAGTSTKYYHVQSRGDRNGKP